MYLFFGSGQFDALDEGLLGEEEGNHDRDREDSRRRHQLVPDHTALTLEILQAKRHREILRAGQEEQWSGEIVPGP